MVQQTHLDLPGRPCSLIFMCIGGRKGVPQWNPGSGAELDAFCTLIHSNLIPVLQVRELQPMEVHDGSRSPAQVHPTLPSLLPEGPDGKAEMHRELLPARGCWPSEADPTPQRPSSRTAPNASPVSSHSLT